MGKGGSTTSVTVPAWLEEAAKRNITRGDKIAPLGSVPLSFGPTVAGFTDSQIAGFDNTSNTASAFGLNAPGAFSMGTPIEYANGVRGYSAAPLFDQKMNAFAEARPGQKSYIDSFFIDPFSGNYGYNATMPIDYSLAFPQTTDTSGNTGGGSTGGGGSSTTTPNVISTVPDDQSTGNFYQDNQIYNPDIDYTDPYVASNDQIVGTLNPSDENLQVMKDEYGIDPGVYTDPNNPIYSASDFELGSSTKGTDYTVYDTSDNNNSTTATNKYGSTVSVGYGVGQVDPGLAAAAGYDTNTPPPGVVGNNNSGSNSFAQTMANLATPNDGTSYVNGVLTYDAPTPSSVKNDDNNDYNTPTFTQDLTQSLTTDVDLPGNVVTRALNIGAGKKDESSDSGYAGDSGDGCVIATHAVASGAFNPQTKRAAVVWCMNNLHDRWWGEAVRRGYRHLGRKKIEQGKAREHYDEFRRYIDFASGKKRTLRGALTFTLRTTQFFVVGMLNKEA